MKLDQGPFAKSVSVALYWSSLMAWTTLLLEMYQLLRDMPTEVYCTRANTLPVKEVWMVSDVCGKIKGMKID